ncbi:MAG: hypothetical protein IJM76_09430 [Lachnospiraceae bacterium]|nr:hypothetical protein [Lachnospiraceae bacterium]
MKKRMIFIELTSLLDVILIMLFVLLMQAQSETDKARVHAEEEQAAAVSIEAALQEAEEEKAALISSAAALSEELAEANEALDKAARKEITESLVLKNSRVLTVSVPREELILVEEDEPSTFEERIVYDWENGNYAYNRLKAVLHERFESLNGQAFFVVFQYDREMIYRSAYDLILQAVQELKLEAKEAETPLSFIEMDVRGAE